MPYIYKLCFITHKNFAPISLEKSLWELHFCGLGKIVAIIFFCLGPHNLLIRPSMAWPVLLLWFYENLMTRRIIHAFILSFLKVYLSWNNFAVSRGFGGGVQGEGTPNTSYFSWTRENFSLKRLKWKQIFSKLYITYVHVSLYTFQQKML